MTDLRKLSISLSEISIWLARGQPRSLVNYTEAESCRRGEESLRSCKYGKCRHIAWRRPRAALSRLCWPMRSRAGEERPMGGEGNWERRQAVIRSKVDVSSRWYRPYSRLSVTRQTTTTVTSLDILHAVFSPGLSDFHYTGAGALLASNPDYLRCQDPN